MPLLIFVVCVRQRILTLQLDALGTLYRLKLYQWRWDWVSSFTAFWICFCRKLTTLSHPWFYFLITTDYVFIFTSFVVLQNILCWGYIVSRNVGISLYNVLTVYICKFLKRKSCYWLHILFISHHFLKGSEMWLAACADCVVNWRHVVLLLFLFSETTPREPQHQ